MNGRIIELARQATGRQVVGASDFADWDVIERLAESIVQECREVSLKNSHRDDDMGAIIARQIKEHFGVE